MNFKILKFVMMLGKKSRRYSSFLKKKTEKFINITIMNSLWLHYS